MSLSLHVDRRAGAAPAAATRPPLVMLHGWGMNLRAFDGLRHELAEQQTWAIDLPGHGKSAWWPEAAQFQAQCDAVLEVLPPRCVLVGWSFGAQVALQLAAQHPARIAALVLLAATPRFIRSDDWPHGMEVTALRAFRTVLEQDWRRTLDDFMDLQLRGSREAEASVQVLRTALLAQGAPQQAALMAGLSLLEDNDLRACVPRVLQPVLVVAGRNDRVTPPGAGHWLATRLCSARLLELARCGHAPLVSHRMEVATAMRRFIEPTPAELP